MNGICGYDFIVLYYILGVSCLLLFMCFSHFIICFLFYRPVRNLFFGNESGEEICGNGIMSISLSRDDVLNEEIVLLDFIRGVDVNNSSPLYSLDPWFLIYDEERNRVVFNLTRNEVMHVSGIVFEFI